MKVSEILGEIAKRNGAEALLGANVLVGIDRPLDEAIRHALALGPYHPGRPSPWSHCFILAEPFDGPNTRILDCTIRDPDDPGKLLFTDDLQDVLRLLTQRSGGIYQSRLGDYDDQRVHPVGVKLIPSLSLEQRQLIVDRGDELRQAGFTYDLPGLLRELVRLITGITIPPGPKLLFCSAFNQASYRRALGQAGDFNHRVADADTTPDDIWYSPLGAQFAGSLLG